MTFLRNWNILISLIFTIVSCNRASVDVPESIQVDTLLFHCLLGNTLRINHEIKPNGTPLPEELIIMPGVYNINGIGFHAEKEGLLRILFINKQNFQRIIFKTDTIALISALSWIVTHGNNDNSKTDVELTFKALSNKLYLTCGPTANWVISLLKSKNINAREV